MFASFPNASAAVMWRDVMRCCAVCSHTRAGHAQRLHNPRFSWHTTPPALHLSRAQRVYAEYSEVEQAQMVGWAPRIDIIAVPGRAGRGGCRRVKVSEGARANGNIMLRMNKLG